MKRRTFVYAAIVAGTLVTATACSSGDTSSSSDSSSSSESSNSTSEGTTEIGGTLVLYTPNEQNMLDALIPVFEDETGIDVELVTAGTGELYQRIRAELANPQGDVMFGGSTALAVQNSDLWEEFTSSNNDAMLPLGQNIGGISTPYQADGSNLLVNTDIGAEYNITSYEDLLNPDLKGQIAFGDPTSSSSAFAQLTNMLLAMGGYESDEAWEFVEELVVQLDGNVIGSSSQVAQDTANEEFAVALTYEPLSVNFVASGSAVEIVYPAEGAVFLPAGSQIIKGATNIEQAKAFLDFVTSETGQGLIASETNGRPLREGITSPNLIPLEEIVTLEEDSAFIAENRDDIVARYQQILEANL